MIDLSGVARAIHQEREDEDWRSTWKEFAAKVERRLEAGANEYGDVSHLRDPHELLGEIEEELADICGWASMLYRRIKALQRDLKR